MVAMVRRTLVGWRRLKSQTSSSKITTVPMRTPVSSGVSILLVMATNTSARERSVNSTKKIRLMMQLTSWFSEREKNR